MPTTASPVQTCPICGHAASVRPGTYNGFAIYHCATCDGVFADRTALSSVDYDAVYASMSGYHAMVADARRAGAGTLGVSELWWSKRTALKWLPRQTVGRKLIDLGCGAGTFLCVAKRQGWDVQGLELSSSAARVATEIGVPTVCASFDGAPDEFKGRFDAVVSFEVMEHVADPRAFARQVRALLNDDGVAFLTVPNRGDPYVMQLQIPEATPPVHVTFFNAKSVRRLLMDAGFARVQTQSLPLPTASVRMLHGRAGLLKRLPWLALRRLFGAVDGSTLLVKCWVGKR